MPKFEVVIAQKAEDDLIGIYRYIAPSDGVEQAERIQERLMHDVRKLESLPSRGKISPELLKLGIDEYREMQAAPRRIFYYVSGNIVGVVAVLDGRRNIGELLQKRLLQ
jgi:toxin ParE1/3/4